MGKKNKLKNSALIETSDINLKSREDIFDVHTDQDEDYDDYDDFAMEYDEIIVDYDRDSDKKLSSYRLVKNLINKEHIIYCNKQFLHFNGEFYAPVDEENIITLMKKHLTEAQKEKLRNADYKDAVKNLRSEEAIFVKDIPLEKGLVLFENGLYNTIKKKFVKSSPDKFVMNKINARYFPDKKIKTPYFNRFLETASGGDKQIKKLILAFIGYCLLPENDGKCFFVFGTARNSGKSKFVTFLEQLVGNENVSNIALHDMAERFALESLPGKILNTNMDLDADIVPQKAVSRIKALTGGDGMNIDIKHCNHTSYRNRAKFVFASNHPVILSHADSAFWDRVIFIPFMNSIPKQDQDKDFVEKLWAERDGIVRKAMKAAKKLRENNFEFPYCEVATKTLHSWIYGRNYSIYHFITNYCILSDDKKVRTHTIDLYKKYIECCENEDFDSVTMNQFSRILTDVFELEQNRWVSDGPKSRRGFEGVSLKKSAKMD